MSILWRRAFYLGADRQRDVVRHEPCARALTSLLLLLFGDPSHCSPSMVTRKLIGEPPPLKAAQSLALAHVTKNWHLRRYQCPGGEGAGVDARRATPREPRHPHWGLAGSCQLDPSHPVFVTCGINDFDPCHRIPTSPVIRQQCRKIFGLIRNEERPPCRSIDKHSPIGQRSRSTEKAP